jgi:nicotinate-nucleotide pyrophosphorylase
MEGSSALTQSLSRDFASHDSSQQASWTGGGLSLEGSSTLPEPEPAPALMSLRRSKRKKSGGASVDFASQDLLSHDSLASASGMAPPLLEEAEAEAAEEQETTTVQTSAVVEALWEMCDEDELRELAFAFTSCDVDDSNSLEADELGAMLVMHTNSVTIDQVTELMRIGKASYADWSDGQISDADKNIMLDKMMGAAGMQLGTTKHGGMRTFAELNIQERHKQLRGLATGAISFVEDTTKQAAKLVEEQSKAAVNVLEEKTGVIETTRKAANLVEDRTGVLENTRKAAQIVDDRTGATDKARKAATSIQEGAKGLDEAREVALETARSAAKEIEGQSKKALGAAEERANQAARLAEEKTKVAVGAIEGSAKQLTDTSKNMANMVERRTGLMEMTKQGLSRVEAQTGVMETTRKAANVIDGATGASDKARLAAMLVEENTLFLADQLTEAKRAFQKGIDDREKDMLSVDFAEYLFTMQSKEMQEVVEGLDPHTLAQQMRSYRNAFDMVDVDGNNELEFDELEMVVLSLNPHLMLTDDDLLYLWGVLTEHAAAQHAEMALREAQEEWEREVQQELDDLDQKVAALDGEEGHLNRRLKLRFSGELTPKEENWIRRRCGKIAEEREALREPRQQVLEKLLNPAPLMQPEPEPEPEPDMERPAAADRTEAVAGAQVLCEGLVQIQYAGKGDFTPAWLSVGSDGIIVIRDTTGMPPKFAGKWQGQILRTASALQSGIRPPKKRRRGIKSAIRVDLAKRDTCGDIKVRKRIFCAIFILKGIILPRQARDKRRESTQKRCVLLQWIVYVAASAKDAMTLDKLRKTLMSFAIGRWEDSRAIMLDFNQFLHGMAAVQRNERTSQWLDIFRPNRWELLSLIIDTPVSEAEEERILTQLSSIERVGVGMLRRHWQEMDMANMRSVLTKAGGGELRFLEEQQIGRMHKLHDKAVLISGLIGLVFAAIAALVENILVYELGINGFKDTYWVCSLESQLDFDANSTTYGSFIPTFPELAHPDLMMCTTIHVNATSCIDDFMHNAPIIVPEDVHDGAGYYPPGTTAEDLGDVFGHHQNGLHGWTTLETGSETMEHICSKCECTVCGCATHAPVIGRVELGTDNKQVIFWAFLAPTLAVAMSAEVTLLLYCAMRYTTRVAWALDIRLTPLNTDRAFVAESLVRAAFELGNPDSPLLGVDPQQAEGDASKVLVLMLFKLKTFLTGTFVKLIIGLVCSPETALWLKPWLGMVTSAIVWDGLTCHNLMVQARIRGFGVYASVELFNEIIDESYTAGRGEVDADTLSPLAKIQIARAVGVAIVIHGSLHPSMELLLRHALQFLGLRGSKFVAQTGVLDNREGFIRDLTAGAWAVLEEEEQEEQEEIGTSETKDRTLALDNPIFENDVDEDEHPPRSIPLAPASSGGSTSAKKPTGLKSVDQMKRSRRLRSSGLWSMVSGDESNVIEKISREDQIAVLCVHLLAFVLDGFLDPKELELWKNVCDAVGECLTERAPLVPVPALALVFPTPPPFPSRLNLRLLCKASRRTLRQLMLTLVPDVLCASCLQGRRWRSTFLTGLHMSVTVSA